MRTNAKKKKSLFFFISCYLKVANDRDSYAGNEAQNNADNIDLPVVSIVPNLLETDHHDPEGWEKRKATKMFVIIYKLHTQSE